MAIDHKSIGSQARKRRVAAGLSLEAAAGHLGITTGFLSYLENGKRSWTKRLYMKAMSL